MKAIQAVMLLMLGAAAEPRSAPATVEAQVVAYNRHDADAFAVTYAEDAQVYRAGEPVPLLAGRAAIRARYAALFRTRPDITVDVSARLTAGDYVSDHETIRGTAARAIVVYEVRDGLIRRAWLFGPPAG